MHSCAILSDKSVKCWGLGREGQLGNASNTSSSTPVVVSNVSNAVEIAAGDYHTCALSASGSVQCWGLGNR
jgi:alpha-tubulin suppressor-like RCC1 family protein